MHACPNLKSLSLMLLLDDQPFIDEASDEEKLYTCTNVLNMLATIQNSKSLRHITFKLAFEAEDETPGTILDESIDWERMHTLLNGFVNLEKVSITFTDGADALEDCRPVMLEKLRDLDQQGLLELKVLNEENLPIGAKI